MVLRPVRYKVLMEVIPCIAICGGYFIILAVVILLAFLKSYHEDEWSVEDIFALLDGFTFELFGIKSSWIQHHE